MYITEAEYITLFQSLRDTITMMQLMMGMKVNGLPTLSSTLEVNCKAFEDNSGALELAHTLKMQPCTKHINQVYHHLRDFVPNGKIHIFAIESVNQIAGIFTKFLPHNEFLRHRTKLLRW